MARLIYPPPRNSDRPPQAGRRSRYFKAAWLLSPLAIVFAVSFQAQTEVPNDWSLKPSAIGPGDQFRLIFVSSSKRNATASAISTYDTHVQSAAASGHSAIQSFSSQFKALGCTASVDARDHTSTTYTTSDKGVPIYWVNGGKVADDYEDFYDGNWDNNTPKEEDGTNATTSQGSSGSVHTGCDSDGTGDSGLQLGSSGNVMDGLPGTDGKELNDAPTTRSNSRRIYGLSGVFQVAAASTDATLSALALEDEDSNTVTLTPAFASATTSYTASVANSVDEVTIEPTVNESNATFEFLDSSDNVLTDADSVADKFQVDLSVGENTIKVKVTAEDGNTTETYTVVVTRAVPVKVEFDNINVQADEDAGTVSLIVNLSRSHTDTVTVDYATSDNTAISGEDYTTTTGTLTFATGDTTKTIVVPIIDDQAYGGIKRFNITLSNPSGAELGTDSIAQVVISNDEAAPTVTMEDVTVSEGNGTMTLTLRLSHLSELTATFDTISSHVGGTATESDDYVSFVPNTGLFFNVPAGQLSATLDITIVDDALVEPDETITIAWFRDDAFSTPTSIFFTGTIEGSDATGKPGITGVPQVGQTLTATAGDMADDDNLPTTTFPTGYSFQWVRTDADGSNPQDISGATSATYQPVAADVGKKLLVKVDFTDGGGAEEQLESDGTATVVAKQENCDATDRPGHDWCAEMTVGDNGTNLGFSSHGGGLGMLSDTTYDYGDVSYTVSTLQTYTALDGDLVMLLEQSAFVPRGSVFDFGGSDYPTDSNSESSTNGTYTWDAAADLDWIDGMKVTVSANLAPIVTAATVDDDELVLTFAEDVDTTSRPAASAFEVKVDGTGAAPSSVDTISGKTVTMTLATAVTSGQTVTVSYTAPGMNPLQDESGLDAPSFTDEAVTNNTGATLPVITIAADGDVNETEQAEFTLARTGDTGNTLTVDISVDDDGTNPVLDPDATLPTEVTFEANAATAALSLATADIDAAATPDVTVTLDTGTGYTVGTPTSDAVTVSAGICGRTEKVRNAILSELSLTPGDCADVADNDSRLAGITGTLDLAGESIGELRAKDFAGLSSLTELELEDNALTSLPEGVFDELTALTVLGLGENLLTESGIPADVFGELGALTRLALYANHQLTGLPEGVFDELTNLTLLNLQGSSGSPLGLTSLRPGVFDQLVKLEVLRLANLRLSALPADVFDNLTALTDLGLATNLLATVPDGVFEDLTALVRVTLGDNPGAPFTPVVSANASGTLSETGGTVSLTATPGTSPWNDNVSYDWVTHSKPAGATVAFDDDGNGTANTDPDVGSGASPKVIVGGTLTDGDLIIITLTATGRGDVADGTAVVTDSFTLSVNDTTAPSFSSATVDGASLVITFDENLAVAANLANSAFTVKKTPSGGSEETVTLSGSPSISGATVTLTLDTAVVSTDGGVKVSYTKPTTGTDNTLQDAAGNEVADFSDQTVANTTSATNNAATGKPTITGPAQVGMTLTAATDDIADADGLTNPTFIYQWIRGGSDITGETGSTYVPTSSDVGDRIRVRVSFTDDAGNPEEVTSDQSRPVVPDAELNCDAPDTIWCTTLTTGHLVDEIDPGDFSVEAAGYSALEGYGSLADATFEFDGVVYTVTQLFSGAIQSLLFTTTPTLPEGNGLTVHVQRVVGELSLPLADGELEADGDWFFESGLSVESNGINTFNDVPLLQAPRRSNLVVPEPTDVGTEIGVRMSVSEVTDVGDVLVSNIRQPLDEGLSTVDFDHAQGFITGNAAGGYTLTAIDLAVTTGAHVFGTVTLHKDSPTNAVVATLNTGTVPSGGTARVTAPAGTTLDLNSTYYVVFDGGNVSLSVTVFAAEDADSLPDWEILDVHHSRDKNSTGAFAAFAKPMLIRVHGYVGTNIGNSPATGQPGITGTAEVGETLSASLGDIADLDGLPALFPDDYTIQWVRVDADGTSNKTEIPDATASTYTLTSADEGRRILVELRFTDAANNLEGPLVSDPYPSFGTVTEVDETAPAIVSARVKDDVLTVVFDEDLAPAPNLGNSAFTVTKVPEGGSRENVSLSGSPTISGAILTLTLASAVEATDTAIQLDYDRPTSGSGNRLADAAGNEVASFSGQAVTLDLVTVTTWHVYFDQTEYTATEGGAGARVKVLLSAPWKPDLNASLTVPLSGVERYGGASEGDFSGVPENVTFAPGQTEVAFTVTATDDNADDDGESIRFGIASVRPFPEDLQIGRGPGAVRVHLEDNDGPRQVAVSFGARAYTAVEGGADATVAVRLNKAPGRSVTIPLTTRHANAGDFSGVPESVTFGANETIKSFDVVAVDDTLNDDLSIVTLGFGELPDGVTRGDPSETVVNLEDNDGTQRMLTLRFSAPDTKVRELREGISFRLGVFLNETTNARVPIPLEVTYTGGATADDVAGVPATVLITGREGYVTVRAVDDADIDPDEGFTVTFGDLPAGVEADELADEAHFTILDNDAYPVIDVADGRVQEPAQNAYRYLTFAVTLSQAYDERVEVNYRTRNGTAKAGQDFEGTRETLTFPRRTTTGTAWVKVYGDDHNEGTETFTLELSDPINATLGDHTAIGRIDNTGVMPGAWLSRFGRAASDASIEAIGRRMTDERQDSHLTLGTDGFSRLRSWASVSEDHPLDTSDTHWTTDDNTTDPGGSDIAPMDFGSLGMTTDVSSLPGTGSQSGIDALVRHLGVPDLHDLLTGSSFFYAPDENGRVPQWLESAAAWGETTVQQFRGNEGTLNLDGELATATLGFDTQHDRWLAGLALSYTEGTGAYTRRGKGGGDMTSALTTLNPYLRYQLSGRTDVWGILGYGTGALALTPDRADDALQTDLSHAMAAFGGRSTLALRAGDTRRFELAVRSDARLTRTASSTVEGLSGAVGDTGRLRMLLEGTGSVEIGRGTLTPTIEAGLRYDGGDAETGAGLEIGGGLGYSTGRLKVHLDTRELLVHQATGYQEWGLSGSVAYTPDPDGRGLNVRLGSSWGNTRSGVQALWSHDPARGLGVPIDPGQRYHADIGYGLRGRALWTPYIGAQAADAGGQTLRLGLKISAGRHADAELELGWQADPHGDTKHGITFGGTVRF